MPTLEIIITFLIILFFHIPDKITAACHETRCKAKQPWVRFPFQLLREGQDSNCGYDRGFDLSCSNQHKRTILNLPSSRSGDFIVKDINYIDHIIWIDDLGGCFPKRLMDHDVSLAGSPFLYLYGLEKYVFLNCPSGAEILAPSLPIDCLSSEDYKVIAVQWTWLYSVHNTSSTSSRPLAQASVSSLCSVISTALIPMSGSFDGWDLNFGVRLAWDMPDCRPCEASGRLCGFDIATSSQDIVCSGRSNSVHQSNSIGDTLSTARYAIGGGILVLLFICMFALCLFSDQPSDEPPPAEALNCVTTEAYPKTQLGDDSLELPNPHDKTCSICLCDYQPKEIIKTIPRCNHYFHVTCIDEWFKKNITCPLCRTESNNEGLGFP